jgi:hypothetical protein
VGSTWDLGARQDVTCVACLNDSLPFSHDYSHIIVHMTKVTKMPVTKKLVQLQGSFWTLVTTWHSHKMLFL